jgi:DNA-binding response OmpR family regulator
VRVLIVDDDRGVRTMLSRLFVFEGYEVAAAHDGDEGLILIKDRCPDLLLLDYNLPGRNGLELLDSWKKICPSLKTILITGTDEPELEARAREAGASFMNKPLFLPDVLARARALQG